MWDELLGHGIVTAKLVVKVAIEELKTLGVDRNDVL